MVMTQSASCPNCGSPISEQQQFCGICGAKLTGFVQPQQNICPGCGSSITPEQQFCGVCGANLSAGGLQQPAEVQSQPEPPVSPKITPVATTDAPPVVETTPAAESEEAASGADMQRMAGGTQPEKRPARSMAVDTGMSPRPYVLLRIAAVVFAIFGWIVLVGGCLASIGMAVFAAMGGKFITIIPGLTSLEGTVAISVAIGGLIASLLYGFGFLAFAQMCRAIIDISWSIR
jgi:predicted nucleic acid-binding Zn ribbon protein